jgi:hypothetical protein
VEQWRDYIPIPVILGALGALWRYCKPRRLISFVAAVKARELLLQNARDWEAKAKYAEEQTAYEKEWGLYWQTVARRCHDQLDRTRDGGGGSGSPS